MNKEYRTFDAFIKALINNIPSFDQNKMWFETGSKLYNGISVYIVVGVRLYKLQMYCDHYYIDLWKYFLEYVNHNKEIYNYAWWEVYDNNKLLSEPLKIELNFKNEKDKYNRNIITIHEHSAQLSKILNEYRNRNKNCGIRQISYDFLTKINN